MFILLLAPDALCWLTGAGVDRYLNRRCPLATALDDSWQAMALDVFYAPTDEDRLKPIEPRWLAARSRSRAPTVKQSSVLGRCEAYLPRVCVLLDSFSGPLRLERT